MVKDQVLAQAWIPVSLASEVTDQPVQVKVLGEQIALFRTDTGVHALADLCVHRGAPLSKGKLKDQCIVCPYHGWEYNEAGECKHIPQLPAHAKIPLKAVAKTYSCLEKYGLIWVNPANNNPAEPYFEESHDPTFRTRPYGPVHFNATAPRLIENFCDVGHFAFLHEGYLGDPAFPEISDYSVHQVGDKLISDDIVVYQPNSDGRGKGIMNHYVYEICNPLTVRFKKTEKESDDTVSIMLSVLPSEEKEIAAFFLIASNFDVDEASFMDFQQLIFDQDKEVVESQKPELLPLDLQAELHLKSDRVSIAYRQYLKEQGVRFGTV
jgi:phenylpropionate dioxygenase-like ring-hydroxylating dioxygenase large terminal subunit